MRIIGGESVSLVEDHEFTSEEYYLYWYEASWGSPKQSSRELMFNVDNIILLWIFVIRNRVSESCPKFSHVIRILKYGTKNCEP